MPQIATSTTAAVVVPQNLLRKSILFTNLDNTNKIYIETTDVATITSGNAGVLLGPNVSIAFNSNTDGSRQIQQSWQAISSAGTPVLAWKETEDVVR